MYERMLNKQEQPTFEDLIKYCGDSGRLWLDFEEYMITEIGASRSIRFPYGKDYGWSAKYSRKSKHICDVFAEDGAFTVFFQISSAAVNSIYQEMDEYAKEIWMKKYPCSGGGWVHFRVLNKENLESVKIIVHAKALYRPKRGEN